MKISKIFVKNTVEALKDLMWMHFTKSMLPLYQVKIYYLIFNLVCNFFLIFFKIPGKKQKIISKIKELYWQPEGY